MYAALSSLKKVWDRNVEIITITDTSSKVLYLPNHLPCSASWKYGDAYCTQSATGTRRQMMCAAIGGYPCSEGRQYIQAGGACYSDKNQFRCPPIFPFNFLQRDSYSFF